MSTTKEPKFNAFLTQCRFSVLASYDKNGHKPWDYAKRNLLTQNANAADFEAADLGPVFSVPG